MAVDCSFQSLGHLVNVCELQVTVKMVNVDDIKSHSTADKSHTSVLLIGDADNQLVCKAKIRCNDHCCLVTLFYKLEKSSRFYDECTR